MIFVKSSGILAEQLGGVLECLGMVVGQDELEELIADMTDEQEGSSNVILLDDFVEVRRGLDSNCQVTSECVQVWFRIRTRQTVSAHVLECTSLSCKNRHVAFP